MATIKYWITGSHDPETQINSVFEHSLNLETNEMKTRELTMEEAEKWNRSICPHCGNIRVSTIHFCKGAPVSNWP